MTHLSLRHLYYASIATTGGVSLALPAALGDIPIQGLLAAYAGLTIGLEIGKLWARRSQRGARRVRPPAADPLVVQALRKWGFSRAEAEYYAAQATGETLEERIFSALQAVQRP